MAVEETMTNSKPAYLDQLNKYKDQGEQNDDQKYDKEIGQKTDSSTENLVQMTENYNVQLKDSESEIKPTDKDDENLNYEEQRLKKSENEMKPEQKNEIVCGNNPFMTELERRISQINKNSELVDNKRSEPVEIYNTQITETTTTTSSENSKTETKREVETNIKEEKEELNAETSECKTEPVVNRSLSDIMMKTIEFGKETKSIFVGEEDTIETNESATASGQESNIEQMNEGRTKDSEMDLEISNVGNINETNTPSTEQLVQYLQYSGVNDGDGNMNQMNMNTYASETMETGVNNTIHMIEINKVVTKGGFTNETVVKNTVLMATSSNISKEIDVHGDEVVETSILHTEVSDINDVTVMEESVLKSEGSDANYSKVVEESVLFSEGNDNNDSTVVEESVPRPEVSGTNVSTSAEESVLCSTVSDTKDSKSTTRKIKDVRFSLPDVLVDMDEIRPTQRSLSLEDFAENNVTAAIDPPNMKSNDTEIGAHNEIHDKKVEEDRNGQRNGFNELLRGFYKTRDLIRREMSYTKQWETDDQSTEEEISQNPDIILEVSEPETENIESNITTEKNIVTVTSVMLDNKDTSENHNVSSTFAGLENVNAFAGNQSLTIENEVVSAPTDDALPIASDVNETTFSGNANVITAKENTVSSAFSQNGNVPSVNVENDENITLVTQKILIADGEKSYINCISVTADETHSNFDDEKGRDDIHGSLVHDTMFSTRSLLDKGTQTDSDLKGLVVRPVFDQKLSATRSNLILSKTNTDITNIKSRTLPTVPFQHTGRKTKSNRNVQDWFHRNDTTQLSTLTLRGHYPDISYTDEPYYISRSWQRENDTSIPYYPFFEGEIYRNTHGIDTKSLSRKMYLPATSERYKKVNSRSSWTNSKSTWVKRLYTNPNHHRYVSRQYHGNNNYKKQEKYYPGSLDSGYQQRPERYLVASPGFIAILPDVRVFNFLISLYSIK